MRSMRTVLILRSVMAALVAMLAIGALASGRILVGVVLAGLAITNVALTTVYARRDRELANRFRPMADRGDTPS